jgi:intracellular sulfur oxidation DsrE/DsrF family protein
LNQFLKLFVVEKKTNASKRTQINNYGASFGVCKQSMERYRKLATNNVIEWQRIGAGHNLAGPTTPNGKKRGVEK